MLRLFPKEVQFFELFERLGELALQAGTLLHEVANSTQDLPEKAKRLERVEHDADQVTHEIMAKLNSTFITPIDREDIHRLATALDDVVDFIEGATEHMVLFKIRQTTPAFRALAEVVMKQVQQIHQMLPRLKNLRHADILVHCIEVNRLENEGDKIDREAIAELFEKREDPLEVMKWRDLYDILETATDKCEDVAVVIEGIFLKNA